MVDQEYELQVFPAYAYVGNTAVLKCLIPRFVKQYIQVISWMWGNKVILTNIEKGKKTHSHNVILELQFKSTTSF